MYIYVYIHTTRVSPLPCLAPFAAEASRWLEGKNVDAVYHTHYSPLLRAATQLGNCCSVHRGTPRRSAHEGFELHELKALPAFSSDYLRPPAQGVSLAVSVKQLGVYMAGSGGRGIAAFIADWQKTGLLLLVRPRGTGVAAEARAAVAAHPLSEYLNLTVEAVDSWEATFGRLQRLLPGYMSAAKGPLVALTQTHRSTADLLALAPTLCQLPLVEVPAHGGDGEWGNQLLLGSGWQAVACEMALARYTELGPWWADKLALSRYTNLPIGLLAIPNPSQFASDVAFQRRLLHTGHLSWVSETPAPDLGGAPIEGWMDEEELANPEVSVPGMYRSMCIELTIECLAVNTILQSKHVHTIDNVETVSRLFTPDTGASSRPRPPDDPAATAAPLRLLKQLVGDWLADVPNDPTADTFLMAVWPWLSSPTALLYEPALHRLLHSLMKKVWLQLLAELRALGAKIVYANLYRVIIATDKPSLGAAVAYADSVIKSVSVRHPPSHTQAHTHTYIYVYVCICIYMYLFIERAWAPPSHTPIPLSRVSR